MKRLIFLSFTFLFSVGFLIGTAMLAPTTSSALDAGFCDVNASTPKERQSLGSSYVKVTGNVVWDCAFKPDWGQMDGYLQWRAPGTSTWTNKHHVQDISLEDGGYMNLEYLPCVKGYHRIFYRYAYREGTETGGKSDDGPTIYLDCRP